MGVRTRIKIGNVTNCPIAETVGADGEAHSITWTETDGNVVEQFEVKDDVPDADSVYASDGVYEITRTDRSCICESLHELGLPISNVRVEDEALYVTLYLSDTAQLKTIVERLRDEYDTVEVRQLLHDSAEFGNEEFEQVTVDYARLTDRQREVLETAYDAGYFDYPREANATDVADELGVTVSTFREHLNAAQSGILDELVE